MGANISKIGESRFYEVLPGEHLENF